MKPVVRAARGYLLSVVAAALAVVTIGSLIVAAYASGTGNRPQVERSKLQALYAAESGLVLAEKKLDSMAKKVPSPGEFTTGKLPHGSSYSVRVKKEHHSAKEVRMVAQGTAGEGEAMAEVTIEASYKLQPKGGWHAAWHQLR